MTAKYVGLMSGTSMDGIDAVLVSFGDRDVEVHATHSHAYNATLKEELLAAARKPLDVEPDPSGDLNRQVGECFRDAANAVIDIGGAASGDVTAIGSHGQTLRHQPNAENPFSLQIGDPHIISSGTKTTTIANFREADIAAGGQGAPLVPPFHQWLFGSTTDDRVVVNIGGIANITVLPSRGGDVTGFDTGPGNGLMDRWTNQHLQQPFDASGEWAASGEVIAPLLLQFRDDPYFSQPPPKSTGFEYFNLAWLQNFAVDSFSPADVQATLCELSALTIACAIREHAVAAENVFVCGGGLHNLELMRRLRRDLPGIAVSGTADAGLDPDWVESVAFAWLAMRTLDGLPGNLPSVTGASHKVVLGDIHFPEP